jgi:DNA topoisomerase-1
VQENRLAQQRPIPYITLENNLIAQTETSENYGAEKNKLFPSDIGMLVTDFLSQHFKDIMDYSFTAQVESKFDEIAKGLQSWQNMLSDFYSPFKINVNDTLSNAERVSGERVLGTDPVSGLTVLVRMGKFGPIVQLGSREETETPTYASLLSTQRLETVTFQEALHILNIMTQTFEFKGNLVQVGVGKFGPYIKNGEKYINLKDDSQILNLTQDRLVEMLTEFEKQPSFPMTLGELEGKNVQVGLGRFGPYVKHGTLFASIPKAEDPLTLSLERAVELILKKREDEKQKMLKTFEGRDDVSIQKGRYGAFIKYGKENLKIPKDVDYNELTIQDIEKLLSPEKASKTKKAPAKKATASKTKTASKAKAPKK